MKFEFSISSYIILILIGFFWYVGFIEFHPDKFPSLGSKYTCIKNYQYEIIDGKLKPRMSGDKYILCTKENKDEK